MEFIYEYKKNESGELEYCETCQFEAPLCEFDNYNPRKTKENPKILLCEICSSTLLGSEIQNQFSVSPLALAQAFNLILRKLHDLKREDKC